jgi:hypothetical protein
MTRRLRDWQSRLQACLAERRARAFAWGSQDCVLLAADCVDACTGVDPAASWRGTYSDALGAARLVQQLGGLAAIAAAHCGPEIAPALAQPGDIGLAANDGRECLVVCGGGMWHAPGIAGVVALHPQQVLRAWRLVRA